MGFAISYLTQVYKQVSKGNFDVLPTLKYYSRWKASLQAGRNSIVDEQPWITFPVIDLLKKYTDQATKVFEYGGGGSTLFFINRAKEVVTVEHDQQWFSILEELIAKKKTVSWSGNLILPEENANTITLNPSVPQDYFSNDQLFSTNTFIAYAEKIDHYPNEHFDIVLVDGRVRPSCAWHAFSKIKKGGYLVIDNSDRSYYFTNIQKTLDSEFELIYNKISLSPYVNFFTRTGIWKKK